MPDFDIASYIREVGGVFRFGNGVLGKSAIVLGILMVAIVVGAWHLHSDTSIIAVLIIGALIFFGWFWKVLDFAGEHPDIAVLEGAEWSSYQKDQMEAKNFIPTLEQRRIQVAAPEVSPTLPEKNEEHS